MAAEPGGACVAPAGTAFPPPRTTYLRRTRFATWRKDAGLAAAV